jgi:hypothetical protein
VRYINNVKKKKRNKNNANWGLNPRPSISMNTLQSGGNALPMVYLKRMTISSLENCNVLSPNFPKTS